MPAQYVVTGPDGQKYRITAPAAASQAEVLAYAQKQAAQQAHALPAGFVMNPAPKNGAQAQAHGPWENYAPQSAQGAQDGPWRRYAAQTAQPNPYAQFVTKSENPFARFVQPQQGEQEPQNPSRDQVSRAFYAAKAAGNEDDARQIIGYIQQHGMTLAPMNAQEENADSRNKTRPTSRRSRGIRRRYRVRASPSWTMRAVSAKCSASKRRRT